jgi:SHS2 domain-containing protein
MPFRYVNKLTIADVAFVARGKTLEELFTSAGKAVTAVMVKDLRTVRKRESRSFDLTSEALDLLLFNFLQEIIYYKDVDQLLLSRFQVRIESQNHDHYHLTGQGQGERIDPGRHPLLVDVKAVTLHKFEVIQQREGWKATVVLDI